MSGRLKSWLFLLGYVMFLLSPQVMHYYYYTGRVVTLTNSIALSSGSAFFILFASVLPSLRAFYVITLPLFVLALLQWGHFSLYQHELTGGAVGAIILTDLNEALSFLKLLSASTVIGFGVTCIVLLRRIFKEKGPLLLSRPAIAILILITPAHFLWRLAKDKSISGAWRSSVVEAHPTKGVVTVLDGFSLTKEFSQKMRSDSVLSVESQQSEAMYTSVVLVIGESATRRNWQLYNYFRDTNRFLKPHESELTIFRDVVSASNNTIQSLRAALSFERDGAVVTLMDLAKQAGYTTYWISNQAKVGIFDTATTVLAYRADHQTFLNSDISSASFDEVLIPELSTVLNSNEKQLIILHLMGSHHIYEKRYPTSFPAYSGKEGPLNGYSNASASIINAYDTSILYTDFFLERVISILKREAPSSILWYFSDHGQQLLEREGQFLPGNPRAERSELEVPMFFWTEKPHPALRKLADGAWSLIDFMPTFSNIFGVKVSLEDRLDYTEHPFRSKRPYWTTENVQRFYEDLK